MLATIDRRWRALWRALRRYRHTVRAASIFLLGPWPGLDYAPFAFLADRAY